MISYRNGNRQVGLYDMNELCATCWMALTGEGYVLEQHLKPEVRTIVLEAPKPRSRRRRDPKTGKLIPLSREVKVLGGVRSIPLDNLTDEEKEALGLEAGRKTMEVPVG